MVSLRVLSKDRTLDRNPSCQPQCHLPVHSEQPIAIPQNRKLVNLGCSPLYQLQSFSSPISLLSTTTYTYHQPVSIPYQKPPNPVKRQANSHCDHSCSNTLSYPTQRFSSLRVRPQTFSSSFAAASFSRRVGRGATGARSRAGPAAKRAQKAMGHFLVSFPLAGESQLGGNNACRPRGTKSFFSPMRVKGLLKGFSGQSSCCCVLVVVATQSHCRVFLDFLSLAFF